MTWFWILSRGSPVLGRGSLEGSRNEWCWVVWFQILTWGGLRGGLRGLVYPFMSGSSQEERAGSCFWNLGRDYPVLGHGYLEVSRRG